MVLGYSRPDLQIDAKDGADTAAFNGRLVPHLDGNCRASIRSWRLHLL